MPSSRLAPALVLLALLATAGPAPAADEEPPRLNPAIARLENGEVAVGSFAADKSPDGAVFYSRAPLDFVIYDMEHSPVDFAAFRVWTQFLLDRRQILERGTPQPAVAPFVRLPANGRENVQWMVKQALDLGAYGILFPHVSTVEEARALVRSARYPQPPGAPDQSPEGQRGSGAGIAARFWGLPYRDYALRADTWPLDPKGELLLVMLIENREGVENVEAIAREVRGIGALAAAPGDLSMAYGAVYDPARRDEVEAALARVRDAALAAGVPCAITANRDNVEARIREGYRIVIVPTERGFEAAERARRAPRP